MSSSSHRLLTAAALLALLLAGGCAVPHSAKVPTGGWAAVQAGAGVLVERDACGYDGCSDRSADVLPVAVAQISAGYGWRGDAQSALVYLTAPMMLPPGTDEADRTYDAETPGEVAVGALYGASVGAYVELGGDGTTEAYGVGASINLASIVATALQPIELGEWVHPAGQLSYFNSDDGGFWFPVIASGGVLVETR